MFHKKKKSIIKKSKILSKINPNFKKTLIYTYKIICYSVNNQESFVLEKLTIHNIKV